MNFIRLTEEDSLYHDLEHKSSIELLECMNVEDQKPAQAVKLVLPLVATFIDQTLPKLLEGGRIFYIGAGTSGRLGILDASECPPTFGVAPDLFNGIIAGGDGAIRKAVEFAEDSTQQAWLDLKSFFVSELDTVIGITASGTTPYVVNGLKSCREHRITTAGITSNPGSPVSKESDFPFELLLGPEFITGSTRLKSGTAQKMLLNMISTCLMIQFGRVIDNKMVDMQLANTKLIERAVRMILQFKSIREEKARELLKEFGSVRGVIEYLRVNPS
ncbi:MAG: N-acetylmuramic acid 6-phosphate etherase [Saprospiraceae bacterium]|nr:N-acetylmuramic acid 6-phosphate etherase [Saprospiraceae bacterium]MBK8296468.1 N-acetylmuramic acid 6-phosphate etherase [Saprospiraceae bacterium]